jgi:hypothetical protein
MTNMIRLYKVGTWLKKNIVLMKFY